MRILVRAASQHSLIEGAVLRAVEGVDAFVKRDPPEWTLDKTEGSCVVIIAHPNDAFHEIVQALYQAKQETASAGSQHTTGRAR